MTNEEILNDMILNFNKEIENLKSIIKIKDGIIEDHEKTIEKLEDK